MTNAHRFLQNLMVFGSVVPLAIFLGYLIVAPPDLGTYGTFALVFLFLTLPLLLKYHHILLVITWSMSLVTPLPGSPPLWLVLSFLSLGVTSFRRTLGRGFRLLSVPSLTVPLLFLGGVVVFTALVRGGLGFGSFGSSVGGGRRYIYLLAAIVGYFALSSQRLPERHAKVILALFFLGGLTYAVGYLVPYIPPPLYFIFSFFPPETTGLELYGGEIMRADVEITRSFVLTIGFVSVVKALMAYTGLRRLLDLKRPWLTLLFVAAIAFSLIGGFRSALLNLMLIIAVLFFFEGLHKTRIFFISLLLGVMAIAAIWPFVNKLPYSMQRTLSILPFVEVDPIVKMDADYSTEWRLRMWEIVLPTVPEYLLVGKGFAIDTRQLELLDTLVRTHHVDSMEVSILAGDYHNGPLTVIIPLGIPGAIAAFWFFIAAFRVLWLNYKWSPPELKGVNRFLVVSYLASLITFVVIFGSFYLELMFFTGLAGLSVSLNGGVRRAAPASPSSPVPLQATSAPVLAPAAVSPPIGVG